MGFQIRSKTDIYKIPSFGGIPNVYFADFIGTESDKISNPIVGAWFRIEKGPESTPPKYEYDEIGVVIKGEMNFRDESGKTATVTAGDTFYFPRGSTITFSSNSYGIAWKCGSRHLSKL
ncbi:hypothetical protein KXW80_007623 [Aspergillus fumigatus]|nr:hypothetical protein KXW80_007623 [Aspergillus fumigatus]